MINAIQIIPKSTASEILFFDAINLNDLPDKRIVPLFGANGSGKTTLLTNIEYAMTELANKELFEESENRDDVDRMLLGLQRQKLKMNHRAEVTVDADDRKTVFYRYRNGVDNLKHKETNLFDPVNFTLRWDARTLSEGQSIVYSAEDLLRGMLKTTKYRESFVEDDTDAILFLDELDSGMSLDNIEKCMKIIKRVLRQKRNIQFFLSFNNPYIVHFFPDVISMYDGKVHHIENIDAMMEELNRNQKMLDKARKNSRGRYKIFD